MTIATEWQINQIKRRAHLLKRKDELEMELSNIHDEILNLECFMDQEDIKHSDDLYEEITGIKEYKKLGY